MRALHSLSTNGHSTCIAQKSLAAWTDIARIEVVPAQLPDATKDQESQFTAMAWTSILKDCGAAISMDGLSRALDNTLIERLWRIVKDEDIYPRAYHKISEAHAVLERYFQYYNTERMHQSLRYSTPWATHFQGRAREESSFIDEWHVRNPDLLKKPHLLS